MALPGPLSTLAFANSQRGKGICAYPFIPRSRGPYNCPNILAKDHRMRRTACFKDANGYHELGSKFLILSGYNPPSVKTPFLPMASGVLSSMEKRSTRLHARRCTTYARRLALSVTVPLARACTRVHRFGALYGISGQTCN